MHQREQLLHMEGASILAGLLQPLIQRDLHSINSQCGNFCTKCNAKNKLPCSQRTNLLPEDLSFVNSFLPTRNHARSMDDILRAGLRPFQTYCTAETGGFNSAKEAKERFRLYKPKHNLSLHILMHVDAGLG